MGKKGRRIKATPIGLALIFLFSIVFLLMLLGCAQPQAATSFIQKPQKPDDVLTDGTVKEAIALSDPGTRKPIQNKYRSTVRKYSDKYGIDWLLVLAVMDQESRFENDAISHSGAYGLMQIMPITQIELTEKLGVEEALSPKNNIKAGVYHLKKLYDYFHRATGEERIRLTLAAYNAGLRRISDAQRIARYLGNDPNQWSSVKDSFPMLSKRNYTLHQSIWEDGKPQTGYFRDWKQTSQYVERVMKHYEDYNLALR